MKTWKSNLEETKQRYINWWNHKGIILNMWEHFQEGVQPHAEITPPAPAKDLSQKWFDPQWRAEYLDWYVAHSSPDIQLSIEGRTTFATNLLPVREVLSLHVVALLPGSAPTY